MTLHGTVALVTGGARRVGRAIAMELARAGCDVAIHCHRSPSDASALEKELRTFGVRADVVTGDLSEPASWPSIIEHAVASLGRLDILVNNAAEFLTEKPDTLDALDHALWERMLRVNLIAPVALARYARPHLAAGGSGVIINMCDIAADRPWPKHLAYCASKAGLAAMTQALSRELAPNIRVNGVAPGIAVFPDEYDHQTREAITRRVPLGREGSPEEVARLVRFLVESADYVTGQIIRIDGGQSVA